MELTAQIRKDIGTNKIKKLRRDELIPAVLYGQDVQNVNLAVSKKDFQKVFEEAGESSIVKLTIESDGKKDLRNVLIHDVSHHYLTGKPMSIDFYEVRMDREIKVAVPIEFINTSYAVEKEGGNLIKVMNEIEVEAFPQDLPKEIIVDLSILKTIGSSLYVRDLIISPKVKVLVDEDNPVVTVEAPMTEEELKALEEQPAPTVEEVKVETEEKKEERAAKEETAGKGSEEEE